MLIGYLSKKNISPDSPAIISDKESLNYLQFQNRIDTFTFYYTSLGIKQKDKVAILSGNNLEFVVSIFALWQIGAVPVVLNTRLLNDEIVELINFTGCKNLITDLTLDKKYKITDTNIIYFPAENALQEKVTYKEQEFKLDNTAVIIFTSGSTGIPKGVMISFNNLIQSASIGNQLFKHTENDMWLASLPFYHVGGFSIITRTFLFGLTLILPQSLKNDDIIAAIKKYKPDQVSFVSTQLKRLLESDIKPNIKHILLGGGFLDSGLVEEALDKGWNVSKSYGSTETSSFVTALTKEEFPEKRESAGKALNSNKIFIFNDKRKSVGPNITGEVAVRGMSVAKGYLNNEEATKEKFDRDIYYTGDYGYLDKEGYLYIKARRNDLIITGGENVNPNEVEKEILKYPLIKEASVFGMEDDEWGNIVAAAIVTKDKNEITLEELKKFLANKIPVYKHPKKIFFFKDLPKTGLGKIQKTRIIQMINNSSSNYK